MTTWVSFLFFVENEFKTIHGHILDLVSDKGGEPYHKTVECQVQYPRPLLLILQLHNLMQGQRLERSTSLVESTRVEVPRPGRKGRVNDTSCTLTLTPITDNNLTLLYYYVVFR